MLTLSHNNKNTRDKIIMRRNTFRDEAYKRFPTHIRYANKSRRLKVKEQLNEAVTTGSLDQVKHCVEVLGADVLPEDNHHEIGNDTPIKIAVEKNFIDIAEYLLQHGSISNYLLEPSSISWGNLCWRFMLEDLVAKNRIPMMELLIKYGADVGHTLSTAGHAYKTILYDCSKYLTGNNVDFKLKAEKKVSETKEHYQKVCRILFDYAIGYGFSSKKSSPKELGFPELIGIDVSGFNFIGVSLDGLPITKEILMRMNISGAENAIYTLDDLSRLDDAVRCKALTDRLHEVMRREGELIYDNGIVNLVPLSYAAEVGDTAAVKARIDAEVNPNKDHNDRYFSPIYYAAKNNRDEIVEILGTHPSITNEELAEALQIAKKKQNNGTVHLIESLVNVDLTDDEGNTRLHHAVENLNLEEVHDLLSRDANVNALNEKYKKPIDWVLYTYNNPKRELQLNILKELLNANTLIDISHLDKVAKWGDIEFFTLVIEKAATQVSNLNELMSKKFMNLILGGHDSLQKFQLLMKLGITLECADINHAPILHNAIIQLFISASDVVHSHIRETGDFSNELIFEIDRDQPIKEHIKEQQNIYLKRVELLCFLTQHAKPEQLNSDGKDCLVILMEQDFHYIPQETFKLIFDHLVGNRQVDTTNIIDTLECSYQRHRKDLDEKLREHPVSFLDENRIVRYKHELSALDSSYKYILQLCQAKAAKKMAC